MRFRLPGAWNFDLSLAKDLQLTEKYRLELRADLLNALNHTNFNAVSTNMDAGNFGRLTGTRGARQTQFGVYFRF